MKCPGQDRRYWTTEPSFEIPCPKCGAMVELFRDEGTRQCPSCGHRFPNPKSDFGCAQWCSQAKECVGLMPAESLHEIKAEGSLGVRLIRAVEKELAGDPPRLARALLVFQHAKQLLELEGGDPRLVLAAALLLPCVPDEPTGLDPTADLPVCFLAGSPSARQVLRHVGFDGDTIGSVCQLIWAYRAGEERNTLELKILSDASRLAQLAEQGRAITAADLENVIRDDLYTSAGRQRARELFLFTQSPH